MAEKNLHVLLSSISPWLHDETFVFCTVSDKQFKALKTAPICFFRENEGISIVIEQSAADSAVLAYDGTWSLTRQALQPVSDLTNRVARCRT